jgi:hypothetical protein
MLTYYGINKCKLTQRNVTINTTPESMIMKKGKCVLIDVTVSGDRNVINKVVEMIVKCRVLKIEIKACGMRKQN